MTSAPSFGRDIQYSSTTPSAATAATLHHAAAEPAALYKKPESGGAIVRPPEQADMARPLTLPKTRGEGVGILERDQQAGIGDDHDEFLEGEDGVDTDGES